MSVLPLGDLPSVPDPGADPVVALRRLLLSGERFRRALADHVGIGVTEAVALAHLATAGPLNPRELSARLHLSTGAVTSVLDRLEASGLARREPHPKDRRRLQILVTDRGYELVRQQRERMQLALDAMGADRLPELAAAFTQLADSLGAQTAALRTRPEPVRPQPVGIRSAFLATDLDNPFQVPAGPAE